MFRGGELEGKLNKIETVMKKIIWMENYKNELFKKYVKKC